MIIPAIAPPPSWAAVLASGSSSGRPSIAHSAAGTNILLASGSFREADKNVNIVTEILVFGAIAFGCLIATCLLVTFILMLTARCRTGWSPVDEVDDDGLSPDRTSRRLKKPRIHTTHCRLVNADGTRPLKGFTPIAGVKSFDPDATFYAYEKKCSIGPKNNSAERILVTFLIAMPDERHPLNVNPPPSVLDSESSTSSESTKISSTGPIPAPLSRQASSYCHTYIPCVEFGTSAIAVCRCEEDKDGEAVKPDEAA